MLMNMPCNCDGRSIQEGFPINFGNGWMLKNIYNLSNSIVKTEEIYINGKLLIDLLNMKIVNLCLILNLILYLIILDVK